jgi:hypothetical protein
MCHTMREARIAAAKLPGAEVVVWLDCEHKVRRMHRPLERRKTRNRGSLTAKFGSLDVEAGDELSSQHARAERGGAWAHLRWPSHHRT